MSFDGPALEGRASDLWEGGGEIEAVLVIVAVVGILTVFFGGTGSRNPRARLGYPVAFVLVVGGLIVMGLFQYLGEAAIAVIVAAVVGGVWLMNRSNSR